MTPEDRRRIGEMMFGAFKLEGVAELTKLMIKDREDHLSKFKDSQNVFNKSIAKDAAAFIEKSLVEAKNGSASMLLGDLETLFRILSHHNLDSVCSKGFIEGLEDKFPLNKSLDEAVEFVKDRQISVRTQNEIPSLLLGDVSDLIEKLTGTKVSLEDLTFKV